MIIPRRLTERPRRGVSPGRTALLSALGLHAAAVAAMMTSVDTPPAPEPEPPVIELAYQIAPDLVPATASPVADPVKAALPTESVSETVDAPVPPTLSALPSPSPPASPSASPSPSPSASPLPSPFPRQLQTHSQSPPIVRRSGGTPRAPTPADQSVNVPMTATIEQQATLEGRVRDAVQAAVHYPAAARMMGLAGRARLRLNYRDGSVDSPSVAQSSGTPMLDQAALKAAQGAHYPPTPPALVGHLLPLLVWVEFRAG